MLCTVFFSQFVRYLVIAMIRLANDTNEPTTENQMVVLLLMLDVLALVLLGETIGIFRREVYEYGR